MNTSECAVELRVPVTETRARPLSHGGDALRLIASGYMPSSSPRDDAAGDPAPAGVRSRIFVRHLQLAARIGVHDWEKLDLQPIVIDLELALPSERPCFTDNIHDAVDYAKVVETLKHLATVRHYELVEAMAETMAATIREEFGVPWLQLRLSKLAPFPGSEVGIVVERGRKD